MTEKTYFLLDDHALMRKGISDYIAQNSEWTLAGEAGTCEEAKEELLMLARTKIFPQIIVVDINIKNEDGIDFMAQLKELSPYSKFLVYSMYTNSGTIQRTLNAGAQGYISKSADEKEIINALNTIAEGKTYIEQSLTMNLISYKQIFTSLSKREQEVALKITEGKTNNQIADEMCISRHAVENYVSRVFAKTGVNTREDLKNLC